jgi:glutamate--cysteine ligase
VLAALQAHGNSFIRFGLNQSQQHARYFKAEGPTAADAEYFDMLARKSLSEQAELESKNSGSFDDFVAAYRASKLCDSN